MIRVFGFALAYFFLMVMMTKDTGLSYQAALIALVAGWVYSILEKQNESG